MDSDDSGLDWDVSHTQHSMMEQHEDDPNFVADSLLNHSMTFNDSRLLDSDYDWEVPSDAALDESLGSSAILSGGLKLIRTMPAHAPKPVMSIQDIRVLNVVTTQAFYLHAMVFRGDLLLLRRFLAMEPENLSDLLNEADHRGNTPLTLAIKLSHLSSEFFTITRLLLSNGANPQQRDAFGWSPLDEAVAKGDRDLVGLLFDFLHAQKMKQWEVEKRKAVRGLDRLPDFYMEIKWEFDSSVIPLVAKIAPHDVCKIWKKGSCIRLDMTLVGWKKLRSKRRNISLVFQGISYGSYRDIVLINHSKRMVVYPLEPLDPQERDAVLGDILKAEPVQGELNIRQCTVTPAYGFFGRPTANTIAGWKCAKYEVQLQAIVSYIKRGRSSLLPQEKDYFANVRGAATRPRFDSLPSMFSALMEQESGPVSRPPSPPSPRHKEDSQSQHLRKGKVSIWASSDFPLSLGDFLPVLEMLSPGNRSISKLHEFLTSEGFAKHFSTGLFPVKLELPLTMTIKGLVTFTKMQIGNVSEEVFRVPAYAQVSRKLAQKTLTCPKKRMIFANIAV